MNITIITLCILWMIVLGIVEPCADVNFNCYAKPNQECVCSHVPCIPTSNPCKDLTTVHFKFSTFTKLPSEAFVNYTRLQSILISQEEDVVTIEENAFRNQDQLVDLQLNLRGSVKNNAFRGLDRLQTFSLKPNFSSVDSKTFNGLGTSLRKLTLRRGILSDVQKNAFVEFRNLTKLDLSFNQLTKIKSKWISNLSSLEELILKANSITIIEIGSFKNMVNLKKLDLSFNNLAMINSQLFQGLPSITDLNLSANKLLKIEPGTFNTQYELTMLHLNDNRLKTFSFADLYQEDSKLKALLLNNNNLTSLTFPTSPIIPLRNLNYVILTLNKLTTFPTVVLHRYLRNLTNMDMRFNPLACDCGMENLTSYFVTFYGNVPNCTASVQTRCFAPSVRAVPSTISAGLNSDVTLLCNILSQPYSTVSWLGPTGESLPGRYDPYTGDTWLELKNLASASLGKYECVASNDEGDDKAVITVEQLKHEQLTSTAAFIRSYLSFMTAIAIIANKLV